MNIYFILYIVIIDKQNRYSNFFYFNQKYEEQELLRLIYYGGIQHDIRKEVWPFLLGHYQFGMTNAERREVLLRGKLQFQLTIAMIILFTFFQNMAQYSFYFTLLFYFLIIDKFCLTRSFSRHLIMQFLLYFSPYGAICCYDTQT